LIRLATYIPILRTAKRCVTASVIILALTGAALISGPAAYQPKEPVPPDSLMRSVSTEDTLALDTTRTGSELDTVVNYSAKKVDFTFNPRITTLTGKAKVSYKTMILTAHRIDVH